MCKHDDMTDQTSAAMVIRFNEDIDGPARTRLVNAVQEAQPSVGTGWDLGNRGPDGGGRVLALINYMKDLPEAGTATITALGSAVNRWMRSAVAADEQVFVELVDQRSQKTIRFRATDTEIAFRLLKTALTAHTADVPIEWDGLTWTEAPRDPAPHPRVFVSYAHENDEHRENVLGLCNLLTSCGVETTLDRWCLGIRRDWQLWATRQILQADYILVVASENCRLVGNGENDPKENLGLQSEMRLLREIYHAEPDVWPARMLPIVLPGQSVDDVPYFLQPRTADHFLVTAYTRDGIQDLLSVIYRKPPLSPPELGLAPDL